MKRSRVAPYFVPASRLAAALVFGAMTSIAWAQTTATAADSASVQDLGTKIPDAASVKEGLFPEDACEELRASGFKCMGVKPAMTFSLPAAAFALGSAVLPDMLKRQLDVFGEVLSSKKGSQQKVRIVGHADASGSAEGNLALSQRRAEAVKAYLVTKGAEADMLQPAGVGSADLKNAGNPTAPENRRVTLGR
ncbi:hypothetical protein BH11PSE9_BH11PSE9_38150 [soil metagenome]